MERYTTRKLTVMLATSPTWLSVFFFFFFFCVVKSLFSFSLLQFVYLFILLFFFNVQIIYGLRSVFWPNIEKIGTMRTFQTGHGSQNRTV